MRTLDSNTVLRVADGGRRDRNIGYVVIITSSDAADRKAMAAGARTTSKGDALTTIRTLIVAVNGLDLQIQS
jgi:hypothetical protein